MEPESDSQVYLEMLEKYGAHAQRVIPTLEEHAAFFDAGQPNFPLRLSKDKAKSVRESIARIAATDERPSLISLNIFLSLELSLLSYILSPASLSAHVRVLEAQHQPNFVGARSSHEIVPTTARMT